MSKNPYLEAARAQRQLDRRAIGLVRSYQERGETNPLLPKVGQRLVVAASRILAERCAQTGEDPAAVLASMDAGI